MSFYCASCELEIPTGQEICTHADGRPRHSACLGGRLTAQVPVAVTHTRVRSGRGRLVCQRLQADGTVEGFLELPESLKQPLMALVARVASGSVPKGEYPVPGGDTLSVTRQEADGSLHALRLERRPVGFPPQGRNLVIDAGDLDLFLAQCRGV